MSRATTYSAPKSSAPSREQRMHRLKDELREHIRFLSEYKIYSLDWIRMAESLSQVSNVAYMEAHLSTSKDNPLHQVGKKDVGTLWDQQRDELAVRILLEEGKLNLLLRLLHSFCVAERTEEVVDMKLEAKVDSKRCAMFEKGAGQILDFAFKHVESLQILDFTELLNHIAETIKYELSFGRKEPSDERTRRDGVSLQKTLVVNYLCSVLMHSSNGDLDEERVMAIVEDLNLFKLLIDYLDSLYFDIAVPSLIQGTKALSYLLSSDFYVTDPQNYTDDDTNKKIVNLKYLFVDELLSNHGLQKKDVRPVFDAFRKYERKYGKPEMAPKHPLSMANANQKNTDDKGKKKSTTVVGSIVL